MAVNDPKRLDFERERIIAQAARRPTEIDRASLIERGERMARWIRKGQVLIN